jgi:2-polyprenyl-3-methyl-5-hydroxy-6-metoxy-1,4-benzoquinol methylase
MSATVRPSERLLVGSSKDEQQARADFSQRYATERTSVIEDIERSVIGVAWGANGFTTVEQADRLGEAVALAPGRHLLDIGTGQGWPGLYLSKQTGCRVTLTDMPFEGLDAGLRRGERQRLDVTGAVVASAKELPFAKESFDAVIHTDVLC